MKGNLVAQEDGMGKLYLSPCTSGLRKRIQSVRLALSVARRGPLDRSHDLWPAEWD